jgi:hypothetical protein
MHFKLVATVLVLYYVHGTSPKHVHGTCLIHAWYITGVNFLFMPNPTTAPSQDADASVPSQQVISEHHHSCGTGIANVQESAGILRLYIIVHC